ncbi:MAG: sigma-70 family RNA polymerase sigma factor [Ignavibacteriales bacterium]|nr:sigma-70 family RNA polymerase sigma factor [Ignavibacteriales bacterium]MBK7981161.1 sigma-70 family RNA polymerase sigma factor [Ignavibacteriota bacterium]
MLTNTKYNFLVQQYKNRIYNYSVLMLKNKMDAEDVTQEVLIRIWKNLENFNILAAKTWIMKTTHNLCLDYLRKRKNDFSKNPYSVDDISDIIENKDDENPIKKLENKIIEEKIKMKIQELPENLKSVFALYEIQGLKYKEISKALDIPINSVKVYLLRARKQLQEELNKSKLHEVA